MPTKCVYTITKGRRRGQPCDKFLRLDCDYVCSDHRQYEEAMRKREGNPLGKKETTIVEDEMDITPDNTFDSIKAREEKAEMKREANRISGKARQLNEVPLQAMLPQAGAQVGNDTAVPFSQRTTANQIGGGQQTQKLTSASQPIDVISFGDLNNLTPYPFAYTMPLELPATTIVRPEPPQVTKKEILAKPEKLTPITSGYPSLEPGRLPYVGPGSANLTNNLQPYLAVQNQTFIYPGLASQPL